MNFPNLQLMNVYCTRYETGGQMWPIVHNTTIFSLVMAQIIALGVFGLKESPVALMLMIPLLILTLLFNEYCRQRFHPLFKNFPAQVVRIFIHSVAWSLFIFIAKFILFEKISWYKSLILIYWTKGFYPLPWDKTLKILPCIISLI